MTKMTDDQIEAAARAIAKRRSLPSPTVEQWIQCCDDARAEAAYQAEQDAVDQHNAIHRNGAPRNHQMAKAMSDAVERIGEFQVGSKVLWHRKVLTIASFTMSRGMPCPVLSNGLTVRVDDVALVRAEVR